MFARSCKRGITEQLTDHASTAQIFDGWHEPVLTDESVGGADVCGSPDLQTHGAQIDAVHDEREQNARLVERHVCQE